MLEIGGAAMPAVRLFFAATFWLCANSAVADASPSKFGVLVDKPGVMETFIYCTPCHSERIIAQQGMSRDDWQETLQWMVEEQGMVELGATQRATILDYLTEHYNKNRPNFPL